MSFKDHFSGHAAIYASARPTYPDELFAFLAEQSETRELAMDCATGNGQAAVALAAYYQQVIATDASQAQLDQARHHPNVQYLCHPAEEALLPAASVDLISVAQALHWLDLERFFSCALATLKPGGLLAVWSYGRHVTNDQLDAVCKHYYENIVGSYWPPGRRIVESGYREINFPLPLINTPQFALSKIWRLDDLLAYLTSWSATQRYIKEQGSNPLALVEDALRIAWGDVAEREISWPLTLKLCRKP